MEITVSTCPQCGNEYPSAGLLTAHRAEIHGHYEPAMMQQIRLQSTGCALWMIYAADGTILDAIDVSDGVQPLWATQLTQLLAIDVMPSTWRTIHARYRAKVTA